MGSIFRRCVGLHPTFAISKYEKNEVIIVGDSEVDIETGRKLGVRTALIGKSNQKQYNEDYSISSLRELLDL